MSKVSWLHISDMHITRPTESEEVTEYNQKVVIDGFFDFLRNNFPEKHMQKPQFVVVTGDLAFSGRKDDYQGIGELSVIKFLKTLGSILGYSEDELANRVYPVAGNHDICRDNLLLKEQEQIRYDWAQEPKSNKINQLLLGKTGLWKDAREATLERLRNYCDFYKKLKNREDLSIEDALWYKEAIPVPDNCGPVNVIGACSSWLCGCSWAAQMKGGLEEKKAERADFLRLGEPKIRKLFESLNTSELNIILMHHDYDSTAEHSNIILKSLIHNKCNFVLCGHEHKDTWAEPIDGITHKIRAGCLYLSNNHRNSFNLAEVENDIVKMMTIQYRPDKNKWLIDKDADPTGGRNKFGYHFDGKTGLLTFPLRQEEAKESILPITVTESKLDGTIAVKMKEEVEGAEVEREEVEDFGFSIRCPYCQRWRDWNIPLTNQVVVESEAEFDGIKEGLSDKESHNLPSKVLKCKYPSWECPAPFEALVFNDESLALRCLDKIDTNWTLRRDFRLFKLDNDTRWEGKYYGVIFNTKPVQRQRFIELEHLVKRKELSRIVSGISTAIEGPVTIYSANIFNEEAYWTPVEGDIEGQTGVPVRYNPLCKTCRDIVMESLVAEFVRKGASPQNCYIGLGDANSGTCAGRVAACIKGDWNHCPDFIKSRLEGCPCYHSDYSLIENNLVSAWKNGKLPRWHGLTGRCHLGMKELAFPIIVHDHLVGVAMTGQIVDDPEKLKDIDDVVKDWKLLEEKTDELKNAKNELLNDKHQYVIERNGLAKRASLGAYIDLIKNMAETRYFDIRTRSEAAFEEELLSYIRTKSNDPKFFKDSLTRILKRMQKFWAFKIVAFVHHPSKTHEIRIINLVSEDNKPQSFGFPGQSVGNVEEEYRQVYALPFFYDKDKPEIPTNPWAKKFLPLIGKISKMFDLPQGRCYFTVCAPVDKQNVIAFVFAVRDPNGVSKTKVRKEGGVSQPAQEFILKTCTEIIREFGNILAFSEFQAGHQIERRAPIVEIPPEKEPGSGLSQPEEKTKSSEEIG